MGLFGRLRAGSSATSREKSGTPDTLSPSSSTAASSPQHQRGALRRSPSTFLLAAGGRNNAPSPSPHQQQQQQHAPQPPPPLRSSAASTSSSTHTTRSRLPWRKKDTAHPPLPTSPSSPTSPTSPASQRAPPPPPPPVRAPAAAPTSAAAQQRPQQYVNGGGGTPTRNTRPNYPPRPLLTLDEPTPEKGMNGTHSRNPSAQTVNSVNTSRSKSSSDREWKKEGGILGKLGFESTDDWAGLAHPSLDRSPETRTRRVSEGHRRETSAEPPVPKRSPLRQLQPLSVSTPPTGAALGTASIPSVAIRPASSVAAFDTEGMEEIKSTEQQQQQQHDEDSKRFGWKRGAKSRSSTDRPPSPSVTRRPPSSHIDRPAIRRPSSSFLQNTFFKSQSRTSLAYDSLESPGADDGSFQLKAFRHVSGASDADGGFDQYASLTVAVDAAASPPTTPNPRRQSTDVPGSPLVAPRPRPPSAADSVDSGSRVSVAAFRKGIRRPSSSVLNDGDDDDTPLSMSRANLRDPNLKSQGSALSLTDAASPVIQSTIALGPGSPLAPSSPTMDTRGPSPYSNQSSVSQQRHSPIPPTAAVSAFLAAASAPAAVVPPKQSFVVRGGKSSRDIARSSPTRASAPPPVAPLVREAPVPPPLRDARVPSPMRVPTDALPNRTSSVTVDVLLHEQGISLASPETPTQVSSPTQISSPARTTVNNNLASPPRANITTSRLSMSPPPPAPVPLHLPQPQISLAELKLPPRPHEVDEDDNAPLLPPVRPQTDSGRGSPLLSAVIDDNVRRFSGLWGGGNGSTSASDDGSKEERFDPAMAEAQQHRAANGFLESPLSPSESRQSLYDRLTSATALAASAANNVVANASSALNGSEKLYIPPLLGSPQRTSFVDETKMPRSPESDRTASPAPIPPKMSAPPVQPAQLPHSSFGRQPKPAAKPRGRDNGWASSSDEDDEARNKTPPAHKPLQIAQPAPKRAPRDRVPSVFAINNGGSGDSAPDVEEITSEDDDEPLTQVRSKSRGSMRPSASRTSMRGDARAAATVSRPSSRSSMHSVRSTRTSPLPPQPPQVVPPLPTGRRSRSAVPLAPRPASSMTLMSTGTTSSTLRPMSTHTAIDAARPMSSVTILPSAMTPSASKWSLSSDSHDKESSDDTLANSLPNSASRPQSRQASRPSSRAGKLPKSVSVDKLNAPPVPILRHPSPRHEAVSVLAANGDTRQTASPASSQSGLTGDSLGQQPMTPRSMEAARRSWVSTDGRPRTQAESVSGAGGGGSSRPQTQHEWAAAAAAAAAGGMPGMPPGMPPGAYPYGAMDMAQAQQVAMMKQQYQLQWMAAAQRNFDDMWERASNVSNAQTVGGGGGMGGPTYGYSYAPSLPSVSGFSAYGGMPQQGFYGYLNMGAPSMSGMSGMSSGMGGFHPMMMGGMPGMMPGGMPGMMPGMSPPQMAMPPQASASMYGYGPGAQSVYGGEFGPPVTNGGNGSRQTGPTPATRRTRRTSDSTDLTAATTTPKRATVVVPDHRSEHGRDRGMPPSNSNSSLGSAGATPRRAGPAPPAHSRRSSAMSGLAMSELAPQHTGGRPPSSWRRDGGDSAETTPRKRVTNAS